MSLAPKPDNSTTPGSNAPFPTREERKKCWENRDHYWGCLDQHPDNPDAETLCQTARKLFEGNCPHAWVTHFDRKRRYESYKEMINKKGFEPITGESLKSPS